MDKSIKKTAFYELHVNLDAKLVPFGGYYMPISYVNGIQSEYFSVREQAGLFDVSHMGEFRISGSRAKDFLEYMTINNISNLKVGRAQYSAMCYPDGGIVDDLIIYREPNSYLLVVNASNIDKDFKWLNKNIINNVKIDNLSDEWSLIALQGPSSREILSKFTEIDLNMPFYSYANGNIDGHSVMLSRTGYTGELGFEIFGNADSLVHIWEMLIALGVKPAGLAARDILRMEMKYCLYGKDINESINPLEAGLGWITNFDKDNFVGKESLLKIKNEKTTKQLIAFCMEERGIPRENYELYIDSKKIGFVTSGTHSPILNTGIGLAFIDRPFNNIGRNFFINIRGKLVRAIIVKPPFIKNTSLYS